MRIVTRTHWWRETRSHCPPPALLPPSCLPPSCPRGPFASLFAASALVLLHATTVLPLLLPASHALYPLAFFLLLPVLPSVPASLSSRRRAHKCKWRQAQCSAPGWRDEHACASEHRRSAVGALHSRHAAAGQRGSGAHRVPVYSRWDEARRRQPRGFACFAAKQHGDLARAASALAVRLRCLQVCSSMQIICVEASFRD